MNVGVMYRDLFESDEDDDDDDDELLLMIVRKPYTIRERPNYFDIYDDNEFLLRFRLRKATVLMVLELIEENIRTRTMRYTRAHGICRCNNAVSPLHRLLLTLRFYATGTFQMVIADFGGIHKSTACRIIKKVTATLALLRPQFIKLPENNAIIRDSQRQFFDIAKFPRVIGAIDCTHVKIQSPGGERAEIFRNRKGVFTINVQAVCNSQLQFLDVVARWPGSTHDSTIFHASRVHAKFVHKELGNAILLGDSGYACTNFLMTPLLETHNRREELYNESQIRTRNVIERSFGVWKRRFPVLAVGMRLQMITVQAVIIATAVLHNIARERNDPNPPVDLHIEECMNELEGDENDIAIPANVEVDPRRILIDTYFARLIK